jgi:hypothetical protein
MELTLIMHKSIYWAVGAWLVLAIFLINKESKAETTTYQKPSGEIIGSSYRMGDMTFYQDRSGKQVGSSTTMGNFTFYSAPDGRTIGNSYTMPNNQSSNNQPKPNPFFGVNNGK